jgi:integrase
VADRRGIETRHQRGCATENGAACDCDPSYRAAVYDRRTGRRLRRSFATEAAARRWRDDARVDLRRGRLTGAAPITVRAAGEALIDGMRSGTVLNRSGDAYKPKSIRGYEQALRDHIYPSLGGVRLGELHRNQVQDLVERMAKAGSEPSTLRNAIMPLRVICRRARARGQIAANPVDGVELPAVRGRRDRVADPREAAALLRALEPRDRVIWATAMYAGLRLGELQALHGEDIDLKRGVIDVRRGWDQYEGEQTPKSRAGERRVPIVAALRPELDRALQARDHGLVFGRSATLPFSPSTLDTRAARAWKAAGLAPIGLHECRHTFASLMIAAGVNAKALQTFMGHASITITLDRYGHLFPGAESEAAALFDAYLTRAVGQSVGQSWGANGPSEALPGGAQLTLPGSSAPR